MKQLALELWARDDEDPNEPPFVHSIKSAQSAPKLAKKRVVASVFDLAKKPLRIHLEQDHRPKTWVRDGDKITGWSEVRRRIWEESEQMRKAATVPPKTPDRARTKGRGVREIDS